LTTEGTGGMEKELFLGVQIEAVNNSVVNLIFFKAGIIQAILNNLDQARQETPKHIFSLCFFRAFRVFRGQYFYL